MQDKKKIFGKQWNTKKWKIITAAGFIVIIAAFFGIFYVSANDEEEGSDEEELQKRVSRVSEIYTEEYQDKVKERLEKVKA